jgi:hypothetical protein
VKLVTKNVFTAMPSVLACLAAVLLVAPAASAQETEVRGFVENATYVRTHGVGLTKSRTTLDRHRVVFRVLPARYLSWKL